MHYKTIIKTYSYFIDTEGKHVDNLFYDAIKPLKIQMMTLITVAQT